MKTLLVLTGTAAFLSTPFVLESRRAHDPHGDAAPTEPAAEDPMASARSQNVGPGNTRWRDADGDGHEDLLLVHGEALALFRGLSDGGLVDVTREAGLSELPAIRTAAWTDYDADGQADLHVLTSGGGSLLLRNELGHFTDVTDLAGLSMAGSVLRAEWSDIDGDGDLDLTAWTTVGLEIARNDNGGAGTFTRTTVALPHAGAARAASTRPDDADVVGGERTAMPHDPNAGQPTPRVERSGASRAETRTSNPGRPDAAVGGGSGRPESRSSAALPAGSESRFLARPLTCARQLEDRATGTCLEASTVPTLGSLYPLSTDLNVNDANGFVGIGTANPLVQLDVLASGNTALRAIGDGTAGIFSTTSATSYGLDVRTGGNRAAFLDGRLDVGWVTPGPFFLKTPRASLDIDGTGGGIAEFRASSGVVTVGIESEEVNNDGGQITISNINGVPTIYLDGDTGVSAGQIALNNSSGTETIEIDAEEVAGNGAQIVLRKADGTASIVLDAEQSGDGRITTQVLEITGGADLVESFDTGSTTCEPGSVVVIDPQRPGELTLSSHAYDRRVAGVVSGAGDVRPGLHMGQTGVASGTTPVALTGRVYVRCTSENGRIQPGDLLTTSSIEGVAMRATDSERAFGSVIGKAMTALDAERGLVLVLVNLQ